MQIALFCHSLLSDWNHGNAHFLRGVSSELIRRGHEVRVFEPSDAWSVVNLISEEGEGPIERFKAAYPELRPIRYELSTLDLDEALDGVDLALVHEWNEPELVARLSRYRMRGGRARLLFHDTHHRMVSAEEEMARYDLRGFDGVLAFGRVIRELYLERGLAERAWVWHEAADTRKFYPIKQDGPKRDLVWVGNWGDEERTRELHEFLLEPARSLKLQGTVHGVRYPQTARGELAASGLSYEGWLANFEVPRAFAYHDVTLHIPRRPYASLLPGIPTIRPFEALACGIPLISAPWEDSERLFAPGEDYLVAKDGREMKELLRMVLSDERLRESLASNGRKRVVEEHSCEHRVTELLGIASSLGLNVEPTLSRETL